MGVRALHEVPIGLWNARTDDDPVGFRLFVVAAHRAPEALLKCRFHGAQEAKAYRPGPVRTNALSSWSTWRIFSRQNWLPLGRCLATTS